MPPVECEDGAARGGCANQHAMFDEDIAIGRHLNLRPCQPLRSIALHWKLAHVLDRLRTAMSRARVEKPQVQVRLAAEPWFIDRVSASAGEVSVDGWSFVPEDGAPAAFLLNDRPFDRMEYPLLRTDVGDLFWQRQDSAKCGFHCRATAVDTPYPDGVMRISRAADSGRIDAGRDSWWLPDPALHGDLPDADRRFRVIGNRDARGFLDSGATDFHRLDAVARRVAGKPLSEIGDVLDWGVGCGRLARHFPPAYTRNLTGCDIDHDNVAWCSKHLPGGRFVPSSLVPPLPFPPASFDLVYGVSVFTHLKAPLQDRWLEELCRITRPGGLVLTTVHGETAVDFLRLQPTEYAWLRKRIAEKGLMVGSGNHQLDGHVDDAAQYVNVFHDRDYVERHWSRWFDVLHVIPGYIFTHDLVVLRARPAR
jgi:SAM-dependent methyltransferase